MGIGWRAKVQQDMIPVASFFVVFVSKALVAILVSAWPSITNPPAMKDVLKIAENVKQLRERYQSLNHPDTFENAQKVKREVEMEELKLRNAQHKAGALRQAHNQGFLLSLLEVIGPAAVVIVWWATPVCRIPQEIVGPLAPLLKFPNQEHEDGCVGIIPWVFICQRSAEGAIAVVKSVISLTNSLTAPTKSVSLKDAIMKVQ